MPGIALRAAPARETVLGPSNRFHLAGSCSMRLAGVTAVYWASSSTAKARLFTSSAMKAVSRVSMLSVPEW